MRVHAIPTYYSESCLPRAVVGLAGENPTTVARAFCVEHKLTDLDDYAEVEQAIASTLRKRAQAEIDRRQVADAVARQQAERAAAAAAAAQQAAQQTAQQAQQQQAQQQQQQVGPLSGWPLATMCGAWLLSCRVVSNCFFDFLALLPAARDCA